MKVVHAYIMYDQDIYLKMYVNNFFDLKNGLAHHCTLNTNQLKLKINHYLAWYILFIIFFIT